MPYPLCDSHDVKFSFARLPTSYNTCQKFLQYFVSQEVSSFMQANQPAATLVMPNSTVTFPCSRRLDAPNRINFFKTENTIPVTSIGAETYNQCPLGSPNTKGRNTQMIKCNYPPTKAFTYTDIMVLSHFKSTRQVGDMTYTLRF